MNQMGAKLTCATCGAQAIVVKGGSGQVTCHGAPMQASGAARPAAPGGGPAKP